MPHPSHSRAAAPKEVEQTGDLLNGTFHSSTGNHGGSAEKYYSYMLLKEKLKSRSDATADPVLKATSEKEEIEHKILLKLINITESSPEFAQIQSLTGTTDRFEQARILAEAVYDKLRAEQILGFYTPPQQEMKAHFYAKTTQAMEGRTAAVIAGYNQAQSPAATEILTRIGALFGVRPAAQ